MNGFGLYGTVDDTELKAKFPELVGDLYTTILAIYILEEMFSHKSEESSLIVRKAKKYLKEHGIDKPNNILKHFKVELKN